MVNSRTYCKKEMSHFCKDENFPIAVINETDQADLPRHDHQFTELIFAREGNATLVTDDQSLEISTGSIVVIPPETCHQLSATEDFSHTTLMFQENQLPLVFYDIADISGYHSLFPSSPSSSSQEKEIGYARFSPEEQKEILKKSEQLAEMLTMQRPGWKITAMTQFYTLLISLCKAVDNRTNNEYYPVKSINEVMCYMEIHYRERIQVKDLTDIANMSESSLNRSFKQFFGVSSLQMLNKIRLRKSEELLKESSLPISRIAANCGFYDSSHFCKKFQTIYSMTPDRFRKDQLKHKIQDTSNRIIMAI